MQVVKYFFEEPASFESAVSPAADPAVSPASTEEAEAAIARLSGAPRLYRGYLSASDLDRGTTGATASADAWLAPLIGLLAGHALWAPGESAPVRDRTGVLRSAGHSLLVAADERPDPALLEAAAHASNGPEGRAPLLRLAQDGIVLGRESTFDGWDWSLLSSRPLADRMRQAFGTHRSPSVRRWVIPLREARGEHRFHFEKYDLELYRHFEVVAR